MRGHRASAEQGPKPPASAACAPQVCWSWMSGRLPHPRWRWRRRRSRSCPRSSGSEDQVRGKGRSWWSGWRGEGKASSNQGVSRSRPPSCHALTLAAAPTPSRRGAPARQPDVAGVCQGLHRGVGPASALHFPLDAFWFCEERKNESSHCFGRVVPSPHAPSC